MGKRRPDDFTTAQRRRAYANNWELLRREFPDAIAIQKTPHYICESCHFVSASKSDFNVDHVVAEVRGGGRNRVSKAMNQQLREAQRIDADAHEIDAAIALLYRLGDNASILCTECNNRKSDLLFVPDHCGLAYTRHTDDLNPRHMVEGPPRPGPRW